MNILDRYVDSLEPHHKYTWADVRDYVSSQVGQDSEKFQPHEFDDVAIRTYLLDCMLRGATETDIARLVGSLKHFYGWLRAQDLIHESPFDKFNITVSLPGSTQIRTKYEGFTGTPQEREISRLRALTQLAEITNQTISVQSILDESLKTITEVLDLETAWISLTAESGLLNTSSLTIPKHGFFLASACNLPTGTKRSSRYFLARPPACHCQKLFRSGQMRRAVNVVECTRLRDASRGGVQNNGLVFHASVPLTMDENVVGLMNFATRDWRLLSSSDLQYLTDGAKMIGLALKRAHQHDRNVSRRVRMEQELKTARRIQASLLPKKLPNIFGVELTAFWQPSLEISGDYYNVFKLPGGRWGFVIADVCGKGAPAALYMATTHGLLQDKVGKIHSPANLLTHINRMLCERNSETMFVTAIYAILNPVNFRLTYACAGHTNPIWHTETGQVEELQGGGMALGIDPDSQYIDQKFKIMPNNRLLFYTDGITDTVGPNGQNYGLHRLRTILAQETNSTRVLVRRLMKDITAWGAQKHPQDDIALFSIGRKT